MWIDLRSLWESPTAPTSNANLRGEYNQLVLIEGDQDVWRTDHNRALMFGRAAVVATALWYLWQATPRPPEPEEEIRRGNHSALHLYRQPFQTVGQQQQVLTWKTSRPEEAEAYDVKAAPAGNLHLYRQAFQTVGQGYRLWPGPSARVGEEEYGIPKPVDLSPFRASTVTTPAGQSPFLWPVAKGDQEAEPDARRVGQDGLHRFRTTFQTVGQPRSLWPPTKVEVEAELDPRRVAQDTLHRFRTGYQTVGQSWQYWVKAQARVEEEAYLVPGPASLTPYRQGLISPPGQPWFAWPKAVADQSVEPNPVYTDHAAAMYPFRPHPATPPPAPPTWSVFIINE